MSFQTFWTPAHQLEIFKMILECVMFRVATRPGRPGRHGKVIKFWKNFWKSYEVLQKWHEILKLPVFKTLNNYFRIFRCYQKTKGRREGKTKRKLEKKTNIIQNAKIKEKETKNSIGKAKRTWRHRRRNSWTD